MKNKEARFLLNFKVSFLLNCNFGTCLVNDSFANNNGKESGPIYIGGRMHWVFTNESTF